jgi:hypothetical protein
VEFELAAFRFLFRALDGVYFPPGKSANIFRGALGTVLRRLACHPDCPGARQCPQRDRCAYSRLFEPVLDSGPSGLADPPRPFVLRPRFEEGRRLPAGSTLCLDLHLFDVRDFFLPILIVALSEVARAGPGPGHGHVELREVHSLGTDGQAQVCLFGGGRMQVEAVPPPLRIEVADVGREARRIRVEFIAPTELKAGGQVITRPEFSVLLARVRDRIATLDHLYGGGTLTFDWQALAERAAAVRIAAEQLRWEHVERRSSRTGQTHPLGGFVGWVEYEGHLGPFLGLLTAGKWTGVGRQTVWGKGAYEFSVLG